MNRDRYILIMKLVIIALETNTKSCSVRKVIKHCIQLGKNYNVAPIEIMMVLDVIPMKMVGEGSTLNDNKIS